MNLRCEMTPGAENMDSWADPEGGGGQGVRTPSEKSQNVGFLSILVQIP